MAYGGHISDDDLERYLLNMVTQEDKLAPLEEHLLACGACIRRAQRSPDYMKVMRTALNRYLARRTGRAVHGLDPDPGP